MDGPEVVRALWDAYQARDWSGARALLHDDAVMTWPCSGERFRGGDGVVHVNAVYPEGWSIKVLRCEAMADGRVLSVARVDHPPDVFFATSLARVEDGRIREIEEYWATAEAPPAWRREGVLPGYERIA